MIQVTMSSSEFLQLSKSQEQLSSIITYLQKAQTLAIDPEKTYGCTTGEFSDQKPFPAWLNTILLDDMVTQLLDMPDEQFGIWANAGNMFYSPIERQFCYWNNGIDSTDIREYSTKINDRYTEILMVWNDKGGTTDEE